MRLSEPRGVVDGNTIKRLSDKLELAMAMLAANQRKGGNPLLFAVTAGRPHELIPDDTPGWGDFRTAATDAKKYYWYPQFLDALSPIQVLAVLKHEAYHSLLLHPEYMKSVEYPKALNIACDFLVNAMVEREWQESEAGSRYYNKSEEHPLWNEPLGVPITLAELKKVFEQDKQDLLKNVDKEVRRIKKMTEKKEQDRHGSKTDEQIEAEVNAEMQAEEEERKKKAKELKGDDKAQEDIKIKYTLVDAKQLGRTSLDIYKEIKDWYKDLGKDLQDMLGDFLTDEHLEGDASKGDAVKRLLKSVGFAKDQRGYIPAEIEAMLNELNDPTLDLSEFTDQAIKKTMKDGGNKASYTRFKRRFLNQEFFFPKYMRPWPQILVMLDTSGSMSDHDIATGVSELKQFAGRADIYIVPVDAQPHWDAVSKVTKTSDFKNVKIKGGGGTVFYEFFRDYREKLRKYGHFDALIVITDAGCDIIPPELAPPCDVGWIITSPLQFNQHFGKPIYLKHDEKPDDF